MRILSIQLSAEDQRRMQTLSLKAQKEILTPRSRARSKAITPETRNVRGVALYMALVARFPLRPLRSERDLDRATKIANELAVRGNLSRWEHDYLDVLSDLIEAYEAAHHPIPDLSGPEMPRHLLTERGISRASAAREMGMAPSTVSDILRGKRGIGRKHIEALATTSTIRGSAAGAPSHPK